MPVKSLQPAMTLEARVIALRNIQAGETVGYGHTRRATRTSVIATVAIGYADGYPR
jgi:alanine racemase